MPQVGAFLAGAVGISATTVGAATAASAAFTFGASFVGKLIFSVAVSELSKALAPHPRAATTHAGVQGQSTASEDAPEDFMLGRFMTPGWISTPDRDHGTAGGVPNAYHTQVRELCGVPGAQLTRVALNGEWVTLGPDDGSGYGQPVQGKYAGYAWIKYYDGSQTVADPMLLAKYGSAAERPWTSTMIGHGLCYAIATFRINRDLLSTVPQVLYELQGIPLYDPRSDSTVGGTGAQRWSDSTTWAATDNPMVMCYNIARGITVGTEVWGGEYGADDLPLADWFTAMNACDATATNGDGSTEPMFRAGYMVSADMQPADVMEALAATCSAEFADVGGVLKPRVGGPGLPVYYFTDDDVLATQPENYQPFPGLDRTYNAVSANYPDPSTLYQSRGAPLRTDATYQAADGGRLLAADLQLQACPYENQVQRLQTFLLKDNRRFRQHTITLPPDATPLEPLDSAGWTSVENGYTSKTLEITATAEDQAMLVTTLSLRERDGADYNWAGTDQIATAPAPALGTAVVPAQSLSGFAAAATTVDDTGAVARIPGLLIGWAATGSDDIRAIRIEIRRQSDGAMINAIEVAPENTSITATQGIVAGITYEARGLILPYSGRATTWTGWVAVVAPTAVVTPSDGQVVAASFAAGATPIEIFGTLPASGNFTGRVVVLTTDQKIYRWNGTVWTPAVAAADITGTLSDSQLAAIAAAKITGQIVGTQVTDGAISTAQLAAAAVTAAKIAANTITAGQIAAGTITATEIAAAAITAAQIAAGTITANELAANSITAAKISAGAVGATAIAAASIDATKMNVSDLSAISANLGTITVDTAHIGIAQIDTLRISGGAVSVSGSVESASGVSLGSSGSFILLCSLTVTPNEAGDLAVWVYASTYSYSGQNNVAELRVNGTTVVTGQGGGGVLLDRSVVATLAAGTNTIELYAQGSSSNLDTGYGRFIAIGLQR